MTYTINTKSMYLIDDPANIEIDVGAGKSKLKKIVNIDFSETTYTVKTRTDKTSNDTEVELVPESMDFLHELTDIFPLSLYDYKIIRLAKGSTEDNRPFIIIEIQVIEKATGTYKWHAKDITEYSEKEEDK